jgi:hypothetical protein
LTRIEAPIGFSPGLKSWRYTVCPMTTTRSALFSFSAEMPRPAAICQFVIDG